MALDSPTTERIIQETLRRAKLLFGPRTGHASGSQAGLVPVSPSDPTKFLNGDSPPAFESVTDADLSLSDTTDNDVSTAKHGFVPKGTNTGTKFLRDDGTWASAGGGAAWVTDDDRTPPSSPNALDDEFDGADGAAINAAWTAVNGSGATAVLDGVGRAILTANVTSSTNLNMWMKAAPATPWSIITRCSPVNAGSQPHSGLALKNTTSGKIITFGPSMQGITVAAPMKIEGLNWTNATTFASNVATALTTTANQAVAPTYYKITNDGTTLKFYFSFVGTHASHWILFASVTLATFIGSVDQIGLFVDSQSSTQAGVSLVEFFRVTA